VPRNGKTLPVHFDFQDNCHCPSVADSSVLHRQERLSNDGGLANEVTLPKIKFASFGQRVGGSLA
jgi:hypothetical protein